MKIEIALKVSRTLILMVLLCAFVFLDSSNSFAAELNSKEMTMYASPSTQALERTVKAKKIKKADARSFKVSGRIDDYQVSFKYTGKQRLKVESTGVLQLSQSIPFEEMIKRKLIYETVTPIWISLIDSQRSTDLNTREFNFFQFVGNKYGTVARKVNGDLETITTYEINGFNVFEQRAIDSYGNLGGNFRARKYDPELNKEIEIYIHWGEGLSFGITQKSNVLQYYFYRQAAYHSLTSILTTIEIKK